jgi:hypothetical protein
MLCFIQKQLILNRKAYTVTIFLVTDKKCAMEISDTIMQLCIPPSILCKPGTECFVEGLKP